MNTLEFEEFNDDCDTEEDTSLRWNNDEAVIEDDNPGRSDAGSAVTVDDSDDGIGQTVTNDTDGGDTDTDDNNSDFDAIVSDSDDVGDASASDPDTRAGDGANDADVGTCSVANDADIFDDSGSDANGDADAGDVASDGKGDTGDAINECDDDCEDTSLNDADADTTKRDNITIWLRLGEDVSVVGNIVSGLFASDSVTNCIDDAWIPDAWSWMGVVTSVRVAVLFVSLTCEA